MLNRTYRLTLLNHNVERALRDELLRRTPDRLRLLRLRMMKSLIRTRLKLMMRTSLPTAA